MTDSAMTEIPLVERLLEILDTIAAAEMAFAKTDDHHAHYKREFDTITEAAAMLKAAVEALEPFAAVAAKLNPELPDDTPVTLSLGGGAIYVYALSRFRKARNTLASLKQPGGS